MLVTTTRALAGTTTVSSAAGNAGADGGAVAAIALPSGRSASSPGASRRFRVETINTASNPNIASVTVINILERMKENPARRN
jgi:hypothetical protein